MAKVTTDFNDRTIKYTELLNDFKVLLKNNNLKFTIQREVILETLYSSDEHLTPKHSIILSKKNTQI